MPGMIDKNVPESALREDWPAVSFSSPCYSYTLGPLHDPVTWYKITYVSKLHSGTSATRTSPPGPAFVLEVPLCNLLISLCNFAKGLFL